MTEPKWLNHLPSRKDLADKIGMSASDFSRAISGKTKNARAKPIQFTEEQKKLLETERLTLISILQENVDVVMVL